MECLYFWRGRQDGPGVTGIRRYTYYCFQAFTDTSSFELCAGIVLCDNGSRCAGNAFFLYYYCLRMEPAPRWVNAVVGRRCVK